MVSKNNIYKVLFYVLLVFMAVILSFVYCTFNSDNSGFNVPPMHQFGDKWYYNNTVVNINNSKPLKISGTTVISRTLPDKIFSKESIILESKNVSIRAFVGQKEIYSFGGSQGRALCNYFGNLWSVIELEESYADKIVTFILSPVNKGQGAEIIDIYFDTHAAFVVNCLKNNFLKLSVLYLILVFAVIEFIISISEYIAKKERSSTDFYLGMFLSNVFLWLFTNDMMSNYVFNNFAFGNILSMFSYLTLPITFLLYITTVLKRESRLVKCMVIINSLYCFVRILLSSFNITNLSIQDYITGTIMICNVLAVFYECFINHQIWTSKTTIGATLVIGVFAIITIAIFSWNEEIIHLFYIGIVLFFALIFWDRLNQINRFKMQAADYETYKKLAMNDVVTDTKNRLAFNTDVEKITGIHHVAIVVIDANNLKKINDTLGHIAGDTVIASLAFHLKEIFKNSGTVYRMGGDEFAALMLDYSDKMLKETTTALSTPKYIMVNGEKLLLDFSYGIAEEKYLDCTSEEIYRVFHVADELMYEDKKNRKIHD